MAKKSNMKQTVKTTDPIEEIKGLESCANACEEKLVKTYNGAMTKLEDKHEKLKIKFRKAQEKLTNFRNKSKLAMDANKLKATKTTKARLVKAKLTEAQANEGVQAFKKLEVELKSLLVVLKQGFKKLLMKQKAVLKFEQEWTKKTTQAKRKKTKRKTIKNTKKVAQFIESEAANLATK